MKLAILLETNYSGGGSFTHSINTCLELKKYLGKKNNFIVYTQIEENFKILKKLNLPVKLFKNNLLDKILIFTMQFLIFRFFFKILNIKLSVEKELIKNDIDFIFFPTDSKTIYCIQKIKFVFNLLDLEHKKHSIYPEINASEHARREKLYKYCLKKSTVVVASHPEIKNGITYFYKTPKHKIIVIPYTQNNFFKRNEKNKDKIKEKNYFFYPAQIWGHKNHLLILKAAKILQEKGTDVSFVFSGKNRGFKKVLDKFIEKNKLRNIKFTGYLTNSQMNTYYKYCSGIIFTSFFGPNTLVALEAWSYKKPLIYNKKLSDCPKGSAILIDPKNEKNLAKSIEKILKNRYPSSYITNGLKQLKKIDENNSTGYLKLQNRLITTYESILIRF